MILTYHNFHVQKYNSRISLVFFIMCYISRWKAGTYIYIISYARAYLSIILYIEDNMCGLKIIIILKFLVNSCNNTEISFQLRKLAMVMLFLPNYTTAGR